MANHASTAMPIATFVWGVQTACALLQSVWCRHFFFNRGQQVRLTRKAVVDASLTVQPVNRGPLVKQQATLVDNDALSFWLTEACPL